MIEIKLTIVDDKKSNGICIGMLMDGVDTATIPEKHVTGIIHAVIKVTMDELMTFNGSGQVITGDSDFVKKTITDQIEKFKKRN